MIKKILICSVLLTLISGSLFVQNAINKPEREININSTTEKVP